MLPPTLLLHGAAVTAIRKLYKQDYFANVIDSKTDAYQQFSIFYITTDLQFICVSHELDLQNGR